MRREAFAELTPSPRGGWAGGLPALGRGRGPRGLERSASPTRSRSATTMRPPALGYDREEARDAARELLGAREHIGWRQAGAVLASYRAL